MSEKIEKNMSPQEQQTQREQLEKQLAGRVQFVEQDGKETGQRWMEGDHVMTTAYFEPTELGQKIIDLLEKYGKQYGTNNAWACIRGQAVTDARELAEKHGLLPSDKNISRHLPSPVYELGVDLRVYEGVTDREEYGDELSREVETAFVDMKKLAEEIEALGVDCKYEK